MSTEVKPKVMTSVGPSAEVEPRGGVLLVANLPDGPLVGGVEVGVDMIMSSELRTKHAINLFNTARRRDTNRPLLARLRYQIGRCVELALEILRTHPRLVHVKATVGVNYWQGACYSLIARALFRPTLLQLHGGDLDMWYEAHGSLGRFGIRTCLRIPSEVIVLSKYWRTFVAGLAPRQKIRIVPNGVRIDLAQPRAASDRPEICVVTIGALGVRKGHFDILDAVARLTEPSIGFLFVGDDEFGGEGADLRARADALGVTDRVDFVGAVTGPNKWKMLAGCDVFLLPSRGENMPNAVLEAMAAGLPIVCTSVGALPEMLDTGAIFVPTADPAAIASAIDTLARDRPRRERMGRENGERARSQFAFAAIMETLNDIYSAHP